MKKAKNILGVSFGTGSNPFRRHWRPWRIKARIDTQLALV